jgi:group II intron reverse transcriptase/maturase
MQDFISTHADKAWVNNVQAKLALRSVKGGRFHKVYNLMKTKRLARIAIASVLSNRGARTPGIDGKSKENYATLRSRYTLVDEIISEIKVKRYRPSQVRRVYIPKANGKTRPLGIPTIKDRVVQEMLRQILEPIYEGKFHKHSYGFRPYRSTHHAAVRLHQLHHRFGYDWAVEGDIKACFDEIEHDALIRILKRVIGDGRVIHLIRNMLSAGIIDDGILTFPDCGTPQGGIVSPLLANIFLNDLDQFISNMWEAYSGNARKSLPGPGRFIVRYADDFVVTCRTEEDALTVKELVKEFLSNIGLELSDEKTHVTHISDGYDFLGFNFRRFRNQVVLVQPSKVALKKFRRTFRKRLIDGIHKHGFSTVMIRYVNSLIRGWGHYYKWVSSKRAFNALDHFMWWTCLRRTKRVKTRSPVRKIVRDHFMSQRFSSRKRERIYNALTFGIWIKRPVLAEMLVRLSNIPIVYVSYHPQLNPYLPGDRDVLEKRRTLSYEGDIPKPLIPSITGGYGPGWRSTRSAVLRRDHHRCTKCGTKEAPLHVHHVRLPSGTLGAENLDNLTTLCGQCHADTHKVKSVVVTSQTSH